MALANFVGYVLLRPAPPLPISMGLVSLNGAQFRFQPYDPATQGPAAGTAAVLFTAPMSTTVVILRPTAAEFFAIIATMLGWPRTKEAK